MKESEQHKTTKKIYGKRMKLRKTIVYSLWMSSRHRYDYIGRFYEGIFSPHSFAFFNGFYQSEKSYNFEPKLQTLNNKIMLFWQIISIFH